MKVVFAENALHVRVQKYQFAIRLQRVRKAFRKNPLEFVGHL
jgi:hypothetical protein